MYVSIPQFKNYRGITSTADDVLIGDLLERAQGQVESYVDRTIVAPTTAATRYYDALRDVSDDRRTLYLDADLASITTITNGDGTAVATTHYVTEPRNAAPYRSIRLTTLADDNFTYTAAPEDAIKVLGRWGYATAAPAAVQQATIRLAAYMYAQKDASVFDVTMFPDAGVMSVPQGMPKDVRELLEPYRRLR
ncbi:MAG: hypothetical protein M0R22_08175 [Dehalococcoidia bacterium]|nr:hypothetical protein [Dehalococcoidia bacterium]